MRYPVYLLSFADKTGLDRELFATFRLGGAWAKRLKKGDRVLIAFKHEVLGEAVVHRIDAGPALPMLTRYAHLSHLEMYDDSAYTAPQRRFVSLQKRYGPHKLTENSLISAIVLSRVPMVKVAE